MLPVRAARADAAATGPPPMAAARTATASAIEALRTERDTGSLLSDVSPWTRNRLPRAGRLPIGLEPRTDEARTHYSRIAVVPTGTEDLAAGLVLRVALRPARL